MAKKPRIVIIGAGMAGLTAANKLYTSCTSTDLFDLCVVEGGTRIGGRINTCEFCGDRIEMGATWIHGIGGSPIHKIAQEIHALDSGQPWECMDGFSEVPVRTFAEGGFELNPSLVDSVSNLFKKLMDFAQGKLQVQTSEEDDAVVDFQKIAAKASKLSCNGELSIGCFLRRGLDAYWDSVQGQEELKGYGNWSRKTLEEAIFSMLENTQRTYTSAGDLHTLDFEAESEYRMFPGEEITIAKSYLSIIESLASVLPPGLIQLDRKVSRIEWQPTESSEEWIENGSYDDFKPVKLHFCDGSVMLADHVIVTVSLGVLKAGISQQSAGLFNPTLPSFKTQAISRLGYGVVNKLFLQMSPTTTSQVDDEKMNKFPFLQMVFHNQDSKFRHKQIPWWMRRTAFVSPIYNSSSVLLSWFSGKEALEIESLSDEEIKNGVSKTLARFLPCDNQKVTRSGSNCHGSCNGSSSNGSTSTSTSTSGDDDDDDDDDEVKFTQVLKSKWGSDPLFLGSYSYVAFGSSGDDLDLMAEPLPKITENSRVNHPLQILFAGEATHRTHYSTTHGAYFSGLREANRLLQHFNWLVKILIFFRS